MSTATGLEINVSGAKDLSTNVIPMLNGNVKVVMEVERIDDQKGEINVSGGKVLSTNVTPMLNGHFTVVMEIERVDAKKKRKGEIIRIPVSELSIDQAWFKNHQPKTEKEKEFKESIKTIIGKGIKDFYRPNCDPSYNDEGTEICYENSNKVATGKSYNWWEQTAKKLNPQCKSRLGTKSEYIAFLAVIIKKLVEEGFEIKDVWNAVCNDSEELGHYRNSLRTKYSPEKTGNREVFGFYDLANIYKFLADDNEENCFWLASGCYLDDSEDYPVFDLLQEDNKTEDCHLATGWIIFEENPNE